jgi:hypothetical protein
VATLNASPTSTTLETSALTVTPPASVTRTAIVNRSASGATGSPTGPVTFYADGSYVLGTANVNSNGFAIFTAGSNGVSPGTYTITAIYNGDSSDLASASSGVVIKLE